MKRDLAELVRNEFDLVIIGGGIFGACAAWDAVLRGLSVALLERQDFSSGASANSFKMVHGGIRYLQHVDLFRLRASCFERSALLRIAPHLVQPLPILIPTYGWAQRGKPFLGAGMLLYDLLTADRNRGIQDPSRRIPRTRFLSRDEVLDQFAGLPSDELTGGAVFYDGQMYNPTRLVLAFLRSAVEEGGQVANYAAVTGFLHERDHVCGVTVRDTLTGDEFNVRSKAVLNAAGGWTESILSSDKKLQLDQRGTWSRDACFVIPRRFDSQYALAIQGKTRDPDAVLGRPARHLFLVPWREYTLVGVWHLVYEGDADEAVVHSEELESYIDEINSAFPGLDLRQEEVTMWNAGLVPFGENAPTATDLRYGKHSRLIDHEEQQGIAGLVSLMGIRYTMARGDAAAAIDLICKKLGRSCRRPETNTKPIFGGDFDSFNALVRAVQRDERVAGSRDESTIQALISNYGTDYASILALADEKSCSDRRIDGSAILAATALYAVRTEMAQSLSDVVFRRTDLGTGGHPGNSALETCANAVAPELGWSSETLSQQLAAVNQIFPMHLGDSALTNVKSGLPTTHDERVNSPS